MNMERLSLIKQLRDYPAHCRQTTAVLHLFCAGHSVLIYRLDAAYP